MVKCKKCQSENIVKNGKVKWFPCQDHAKEKMREPVFSKSDFVEA